MRGVSMQWVLGVAMASLVAGCGEDDDPAKRFICKFDASTGFRGSSLRARDNGSIPADLLQVRHERSCGPVTGGYQVRAYAVRAMTSQATVFEGE